MAPSTTGTMAPSTTTGSIQAQVQPQLLPQPMPQAAEPLVAHAPAARPLVAAQAPAPARDPPGRSEDDQDHPERVSRRREAPAARSRELRDRVAKLAFEVEGFQRQCRQGILPPRTDFDGDVEAGYEYLTELQMRVQDLEWEVGTAVRRASDARISAQDRNIGLREEIQKLQADSAQEGSNIREHEAKAGQLRAQLWAGREEVDRLDASLARLAASLEAGEDRLRFAAARRQAAEALTEEFEQLRATSNQCEALLETARGPAAPTDREQALQQEIQELRSIQEALAAEVQRLQPEAYEAGPRG